METILSGKWTVDDVLEMQVDEISTSASVGDGVSSPLGNDDKYEKLRKAYEKYLSKTKYESSSKVVKKFIGEFIPEARSELISGFTSYLKDKGFQI